MKMLFEDGELMQNILEKGFVPYSSQLQYELHYQKSTESYTVAMLYNWEEIPIPGPQCNNTKRCPYPLFVKYISEAMIYEPSTFTEICG